jgi:hypothetical protein
VTELGLYTGVTRDALVPWESDGKTPNTAFNRSNLPRFGLYDSAGDTGNVALTTQVMTSVPVKLVQGEVVTNISFTSGATAAGTPTNWWFALYDTQATPALIAQTADQTSTAWAAATTKTVALSSAYTVAKTGIYWVGIMVKATTVPTLLGTICLPPIVTGERKLAQTSGSSLTTTAPSTIASPTVANFAPVVVLT